MERTIFITWHPMDAMGEEPERSPTYPLDRGFREETEGKRSFFTLPYRQWPRIYAQRRVVALQIQDGELRVQKDAIKVEELWDWEDMVTIKITVLSPDVYVALVRQSVQRTMDIFFLARPAEYLDVWLSELASWLVWPFGRTFPKYWRLGKSYTLFEGFEEALKM